MPWRPLSRLRTQPSAPPLLDTIDGYQECFSDKFFWSIGAQAPSLLYQLKTAEAGAEGIAESRRHLPKDSCRVQGCGYRVETVEIADRIECLPRTFQSSIRKPIAAAEPKAHIPICP
jgi:hypothetical protein